jgi:hypothetical protein
VLGGKCNRKEPTLCQDSLGNAPTGFWSEHQLNANSNYLGKAQRALENLMITYYWRYFGKDVLIEVETCYTLFFASSQGGASQGKKLLSTVSPHKSGIFSVHSLKRNSFIT